MQTDTGPQQRPRLRIASRGKKTVMCICRKGNNKLKVYVDGQLVDQVDQFGFRQLNIR